MSNLPREKLCEIVATYNPSVWSEPTRFRGLLMDLCGKDQRLYEPQINMFTEALKVDAVEDMRKQGNSVPPAMLIPRLIQRLRARGFAEDLAREAVEGWAEALSLVDATLTGGSGYTPTILTVSASGNGQFASVSEALKVAKQGDTILIRPGIIEIP